MDIGKMGIASCITLLISSSVMAQGDDYEVIAEEKGWGNTLEGKVIAVEDSRRGVTCYIYNAHREGGIFCFTKKQLKGEE